MRKLDVSQLDPNSSFYTSGALPQNQPVAGAGDSWTLMDGAVSTNYLAADPGTSGLVYF